MIFALTTFLVVQLLGVVTFVLIARSFSPLADRGWAISKTVGMLGVSTVVWLVSHLPFVPNALISWWAAAALLAALALYLLSRDPGFFIQIVKRRKREIALSELIFISLFVVFLFIRAFDPAASGTEKPMDLMMLNAVVHSESTPPEDLWLAGEPIAYYYFGYWIYGGVSAMGGTPPAFAYNIGIALVAGLGASVIASLAVTLVRRDGGGRKNTYTAGIASAVFLVFLTNVSGLIVFLDVLKAVPASLFNWFKGADYDRINNVATWRPDDFWWWWKSSRIINSYDEFGNEVDFTIQEFPFFSFLLGDFHPHLMAIPFLLTAVTIAMRLFFFRDSNFSSLKSRPVLAIAGAISFGSLGFINFWDVAMLLLLLIGTAILATLLRSRFTFTEFLRTVTPVMLIWIAGLLVYSPFYLGTAESQIQWPPIATTATGSRPIHILAVWLPLALTVLPLIYFVSNRIPLRVATGSGIITVSGRSNVWKNGWIVAAGVTLTPWIVWVVTHLSLNPNSDPEQVIYKFPTSFVLGVVSFLSIGVTLDRARRGADDGAQIALVATALAAYLVFAAELFFIHDLFGNRMNTVFKFYYQAWILLALAGGYSTYQLARLLPATIGWTRIGMVAAITVFGILVATSVYFDLSAIFSKADDSGLGPNLDSTSFIGVRNSDELWVIDHIRDSSQDNDVLLEAAGSSYQETSRISATTGVPTVIGWEFHEKQWHGAGFDPSQRVKDVESIYNGSDVEHVESLISKYGITLLVVGPRERAAYNNIDISIFDTLGDRVIEKGAFTVFRIES
jgi:YYY domain-containing protein